MEDCNYPGARTACWASRARASGIAMKTLDGGRIGIASQALGLAEGAIEGISSTPRERVQFGRRISQFQKAPSSSWLTCTPRPRAAKWLVYCGHEEERTTSPYTVDAAMAKTGGG